MKAKEVLSGNGGSVYPAPTIVVGVGRFGLSVLERLGEDWMWLSTSDAGDASLSNLRLLHVRADDDSAGAGWRDSERPLAFLANYVGGDDLPMLALRLVILRSLGLVRYQGGMYQVALPKDAGAVDKSGNGHARRVRRRRFFKWYNLSPDPLVAVERLRAQAERSSELDVFLTPIIERVCHGHSPAILLGLIGRCRALLEGRDPSPWSWICERWPKVGDELVGESGGDSQGVRIAFSRGWLSEDDELGLLEGAAPEPMAGWNAWWLAFEALKPDKTRNFGVQTPDSTLDLQVPAVFAPTDLDMRSPLNPLSMLRVDWETNGWRADDLSGADRVEFLPVAASMFRLGFFDHDRSSNIHVDNHAQFSERLQLLGQQLHRGLVRLWTDLQRSRVDDMDVLEDERRRSGTRDARRQSVELLGELIVRPLLEKGLPEGGETDASYVNERLKSGGNGAENYELRASEASVFLRSLVVERESGASTERALAARLSRLGMPFENEALGSRKLLRTIDFSAQDFEEKGVEKFRAVINEDVRHLFDFSLLSQYRQSATRRPPRLTVYVIAEMGEAFSRTVLRATLGALHAELMRAYGPIFGSSRQGFDRSLSIVPIMWMPNPADALGGSTSPEHRVEEAAIIEAIQGTRRWVENLPRDVRCISQIFINSRVTETSVLNMADAVRQTRDFLTFGIRNDVAIDPWLRQTAVGEAGDDLFATFSCFGIDFPAERAREYLANRFVRDAMARLRQVHREDILETRPKRGSVSDSAAKHELAPLEKQSARRDEFAPPPLPELVAKAERRLRQHTQRASEQITKSIEERTMVHAAQTSRVLQQAFDAAFEDALFDEVHRSWKALSQKRGNMDDMIDDLRRGISAHLMKILVDVRAYSDALIDEHAVSGGLAGAEARFNELQSMTRDQLLQAEHEKQQSEKLCVQHRIPDPLPIGSAREELSQAAIDKPDLLPMRAGFLVWLLMAPALGAPIAFTLAQVLELDKNPGVAEFLLGPLGPVLGAVLLVMPAVWLLRRHMKRAVERVQAGVRGLIDAARQVVEGSDESVFQGRASIQSFFAARLRLTASLASRSFSAHVYEQAVHDRQLAYRLGRSVEIQQEQLNRSAEDLGVRPGASSRSGTRGAQEGVSDDTRQLFGTRDGDTVDRLIGPDFLDEYYRLQIGNERDLDAEINQLIAKVGGFESWRTDACFSDTEALLNYGRAKFQSVVAQPVCDQSAFEEEVGRRLAGFVARHYPNIGFGARFAGLEGFDANGIRILADAALIVEPSLHRVFDKVRHLPGMPPTTETLQVIEAPILPNSAYILSLVQGIGSDTIRNLRSFEAHYDRELLVNANLISDFNSKQSASSSVITHLTGHRALGDSIRQALENREVGRSAQDE